MDICTEHGDDIAYVGRDCPACEQIESLHDDHNDQINVLEREISDLEDTNEDLLDQLEKGKN